MRTEQTAFAVLDAGFYTIFECRIERGYMQFVFSVAIPRADGTTQSVPRIFGQKHRIFRARRVIAQGFQNWRKLPDRYLFPQKHL